MVVNNFLKTLRLLGLSRENVPRDVDKPSDWNSDDYRIRQNIRRGTLKNTGGYADYNNEKAEQADRGSAFVRRPYFGLPISRKRYEDFLNNRNLFGSLLVEWEEEDNPLKRRQLIQRYSDRYGFKNNPIYRDYIEQLEFYDDGDFKHSIGIGTKEKGPASSFSPKTRSDWRNYITEAMGAAEDYFRPDKAREV